MKKIKEKKNQTKANLNPTSHITPHTSEKGITLIALVITIIVMLILVAVTISMAVNGGLFDYAGRAATETQNAIDEEQLLAEGRIEIDGTWYNSIDEYVNATPEVHNWTRSGDTFTCSHCNTTYTMGDVVNYQPAGKTSTTITSKMSGLDKYYEEESSYPSDVNVDENGTQTIEFQDATWIVLGIEDTNGNGTNETLLITTQKPVGVDDEGNELYFYGAAGYNNGVEEINRICEELYSNSLYGSSRGMMFEDINMVFEYTPKTGYSFDGSYMTATGNLTTKLKDLDIFELIVNSGTYTPDGVNTEEVLGEYVLNNFSYYVDDEDVTNLRLTDYFAGRTVIKTLTKVEYDLTFNMKYWLASRGVSMPVYGTVEVQFGLGNVNINFINSPNSFSPLMWGNGQIDCFGNCLRPVVSLTSNLPN